MWIFSGSVGDDSFALTSIFFFQNEKNIHKNEYKQLLGYNFP